MNTSACPKCQTTVEAAAMACPSCGSISCRWVAAGLGVPVYLTDASRPTAALEGILRAAFAENLELQRNTPPRPNGILPMACTDVEIKPGHSVIQLVSANAHEDKFQHVVEMPGFAFEQEFPEDYPPSLDALRAMPEVALFTLKLDQLGRWENPTASIDLQTDVDAAAHLVARLLVSLHGLPADGTVHVNTWVD